MSKEQSIIETLKKEERKEEKKQISEAVRKLHSLIGYDTFMIFGPTGSGKSSFALWLAYEFARSGLKVWYLDTERNLNRKPEHENIAYVYTPVFNEIFAYVQNLPKAHLYIIDSIGIPVLAAYSEANMYEKGSMLLKMDTIANYLKIAAFRNKAMALLINQPVSPYGKEKVSEDDLRPVGSKALYLCKTIWRSKIVSTSPMETVCELVAWRDRKFGRGKKIATIRISDQGVNVKLLV